MKPIRVLFICHGNICRSPMAEFIMKMKISELHLSDFFQIDSAATSTEETGNDMYPSAKHILQQHGVPFTRRAARQIRVSDYNYYDYIIGMDEYNIRNMHRFFVDDPDNKITMLLDHPVSDPWYTDDFESAYQDICCGVDSLISRIVPKTVNK